MLRSSKWMMSLVLSFVFLAASAPPGLGAQVVKPAGDPLALEPGDGYSLHDGVVVDPERRMAFLLSRERTLDAVDLGSGARVWSAPEAKPLLVVGDLLIAQAEAGGKGRLEVVSFDARDGSAGRLKARVELPPAVRAGLADAPGDSFRVRAGLAHGEVVLSWTATKAAVAQGFLESAEDGYTAGAAPKGDRLVEGAAALDLASGAVRPVSKALTAPSRMDALAGLGSLKGRLYTSADGRHVLEVRHDSAAGVWNAYRWTVYERGSREPLGELGRVSSASPFLVVDGSLLFVSQASMRAVGDEVASEPLRLQAVDLASGETLWAKDASDPSFRGENPP